MGYISHGHVILMTVCAWSCIGKHFGIYLVISPVTEIQTIRTHTIFLVAACLFAVRFNVVVVVAAAAGVVSIIYSAIKKYICNDSFERSVCRRKVTSSYKTCINVCDKRMRNM